MDIINNKKELDNNLIERKITKIIEEIVIFLFIVKQEKYYLYYNINIYRIFNFNKKTITKIWFNILIFSKFC